MTKFSDLKLDPKVLKAIAEAGYETPTPIQAGAIPHALEGKDVLGIAQTGTGKTASFTLPMITLLGRGRARARMPRSLVLCPTRELAAQVAENFDTYAKHTRLTKALLIGGVSFGEQDKLIDRGVDVLIATPGRLLDHFERGKLLLTGVQIMVVDEADRMLDMGFIPDIERIFQLTPFTRQTLFFSATMAPEIERITNTFLHAPERIEVARQATASETITQKLVQIAPSRRDQVAKQKRELLRALIDAEEGTEGGLKNAIIFCNRKTEVDIVAKSLKKHGYDAAPIHGDLDQSQRTRTLEGFRDGTLKFLVASDVAARGLDIPAVSHVFNFDLPSHAEDYVHRIGRTGRAGRLGTAISLGTPSDEKYLSAIENLLKQALPRADAPQGFKPSDDRDDSDRGDDRGDRGNGRSRSRRGGKRDDRREDRNADRAEAAPRAEPAEATSAPREERRRDDQPRDEARRDDSRRDDSRRDDGRRNEGRNDGRRDDKRDDRREDRRDDRRDDRRRDGRNDGGRDTRIVGMGEHVPEFMLQSFRPSVTEGGSDAGDDDAASTAPVAPEAPAPEVAAEAAPAKKKPSRSRSREPKADMAEEPAAEVVAPDAVPETAADETAEAPAKPKRSRSRAKPKAETAADGATTPEAAADTAEKPKRTRRKKVDTTDAATADALAETDSAEAPAKPKRTRRKKTVADAEA